MNNNDVFQGIVKQRCEYGSL